MNVSGVIHPDEMELQTVHGALARGGVEPHEIYVNAPRPPLRAGAAIQNVGRIEDFRKKLVGNPAVLDEIYQVRVTGTLFPCGLLSPGWWHRPAEPPKYQWKDDVQRWKFIGFNDWGSPSFDWTWGEPGQWDANKGRDHFFAQLGSGDEADSYPVHVPNKFAQRIRENLQDWGGMTAEVVCSFGQRSRFPAFSSAQLQDAGGTLNYCFYLDANDPRHAVEPSAIVPDYYSGYLWKCFAPKLWVETKKLSIPDVYFVWSHADFTSLDVVNACKEQLFQEEESMKRRITAKYGLTEFEMLAKSSWHVDGTPRWDTQSFYKLLASGFVPPVPPRPPGIDPSIVQIRLIDATPASLDLLTRFYHDVYVAQFPDPDERESLDNMVGYIHKKAVGWYGANDYHIAVAIADGTPVGGAVADYFAEPNAGMIEFLTVAEAARRGGLGRTLHDAAVAACAGSARRATAGPLDYVCAEMNDPAKTDPASDNMDPAVRAAIWAGWGYRVAAMPYVQPALSPNQEAVRNLCLIVKPMPHRAALSIPAVTLRAVVRDYLCWAMRIDHPEDDPDFQAMAANLQGRSIVQLDALAPAR